MMRIIPQRLTAPAPLPEAEQPVGILKAAFADLAGQIAKTNPGMHAALQAEAPRAAFTALAAALASLGIEQTVSDRFAGAIESLVADSNATVPAKGPVVLFGTEGASASSDMSREARTARKQIYGGKGAALQEMSAAGMPVPPGFTITTNVCADYLKTGAWPAELENQVATSLSAIEDKLGKKLGDAEAPLLVSVRSGAAVSMPGMMDTVLNLGLNDTTCAGLAKATGDERFAYDSYRRFVQMFGDVVLGVPGQQFEKAIADVKAKRGVTSDVALNAADLEGLVATFKNICQQATGKPFPDDVREQLHLAINAVFNSWNSERAETYRSINRIEGLIGTAVNVQAMVFGNMGQRSGTGVCFTRNPSTGARELYGDFMVNAQGEDVVAGIRTPLPISEMEKLFPNAYAELLAHCDRLEKTYGDMQDIELTVENDKLFILQTRDGKRTGDAALQIAVDLVKDGIIDERAALRDKITADHVQQTSKPRFADASDVAALCTGVAASPGAAVGVAAFTVDDALAFASAGTPVILVRNDTNPEDIGGMNVAAGVLTRTGGKTSHAAVVARGWGKACVTGCGDITIDEQAKRFSTPSGKTISSGDWISINGSTGEVVAGKREVIVPEPSAELETILGWVDTHLSREVRGVAGSPSDVERAIAKGADGIGAYDTDHMFVGDGALAQAQIIAAAPPGAVRDAALAALHDGWREEFVAAFAAAQGAPVTMRLLSTSLGQNLPSDEKKLSAIANKAGVSLDQARKQRSATGAAPDQAIIDAQVYAFISAMLTAQAEGKEANGEIVIPGSISSPEAVAQTRAMIAQTVQDVADLTRSERPKVAVGASITTAEAALAAGALAREVDFLSFDLDGSIAKLIRSAARSARDAAPHVGLRLGGEQGRDTDAIAFAVRDCDIDAIATTPALIPVARVSAAKADLNAPPVAERPAPAKAERPLVFRADALLHLNLASGKVEPSRRR